MLLQAMLGLQQDAPRGKLYVDPALPDWLPDVTLTDLRLGPRRFNIRFWREGKETFFRVLKGEQDAIELSEALRLQRTCPRDDQNAELRLRRVDRPLRSIDQRLVNGSVRSAPCPASPDWTCITQ